MSIGHIAHDAERLWTEKGEKMPTINIKDTPKSKIVKLVDLSEDSINKIAEAVAQKIVEPVKHGHWEKDSICSVCGEKVIKRVIYRDEMVWEDEYDYCPHCGAKMDKVIDETN